MVGFFYFYVWLTMDSFPHIEAYVYHKGLATGREYLFAEIG